MSYQKLIILEEVKKLSLSKFNEKDVGDKWKVFIDPTMAYGEEGQPDLSLAGSNSKILIFEIELLEII